MGDKTVRNDVTCRDVRDEAFVGASYGLGACESLDSACRMRTTRPWPTSPSPPNPAQHHVDHYKCYLTKLSKGTKFQKGLQVHVADQLTSPAKTFDVLKPLHLCLPVDKQEEGTKNPSGRSMTAVDRPSTRSVAPSDTPVST